MSYHHFWMKMAVLVQLSLEKKTGETFKFFDDAASCLGVPYQTVWYWINKEAIPKPKTVQRVASSISGNFRIRDQVTEKTLSDETSIRHFAHALGASEEDAENAQLSMEVRKEKRHPLNDFWFADISRAKANLKSIHGSYEILRAPQTGKKKKIEAILTLGVRNVISDSGRHYVFASLDVPSQYGGTFKYDGVVCVRSGLFYWIFSQYDVFLSDFIFMITSRFDQAASRDVASGTLITMGQAKPVPVTQAIAIRRMDRGVEKTDSEDR